MAALEFQVSTAHTASEAAQACVLIFVCLLYIRGLLSHARRIGTLVLAIKAILLKSFHNFVFLELWWMYCSSRAAALIYLILIPFLFTLSSIESPRDTSRAR